MSQTMRIALGLRNEDRTMASGKTTTLQNSVIDHYLRNQAGLGQGLGYLALYSATPTEAGGGTELAVADNYARIALGLGAAASGEATNAGAITFTATGGAWLAIVGHAIYDQSAVGGNMLYYEDTISGPTLADGDSYQFGIDDVTVAET